MLAPGTLDGRFGLLALCRLRQLSSSLGPGGLLWPRAPMSTSALRGVRICAILSAGRRLGGELGLQHKIWLTGAWTSNSCVATQVFPPRVERPLHPSQDPQAAPSSDPGCHTHTHMQSLRSGPVAQACRRPQRRLPPASPGRGRQAGCEHMPSDCRAGKRTASCSTRRRDEDGEALDGASRRRPEPSLGEAADLAPSPRLASMWAPPRPPRRWARHGLNTAARSRTTSGIRGARSAAPPRLGREPPPDPVPQSAHQEAQGLALSRAVCTCALSLSLFPSPTRCGPLPCPTQSCAATPHAHGNERSNTPAHRHQRCSSKSEVCTRGPPPCALICVSPLG